MKTNALVQNILAAFFVALPFGYLAYVWDSLPERVATHFGIDGKPDAFGAKSQLLLPICIILGTNLIVYFLLKNIDKIDPKQAAKLSKDVFDKIAFITLVFMSLIAVYITHSAVSQSIGNFMFIILGLLLAAIGNLMHSLKQNYFVGLKLPWTLNDEENWRKTHQLGSTIWFWGGLFIALTALFLPFKMASIITLITVFIMVLIPSIYSYQLFKKNTINN